MQPTKLYKLTSSYLTINQAELDQNTRQANRTNQTNLFASKLNLKMTKWWDVEVMLAMNPNAITKEFAKMLMKSEIQAQNTH